MKAITEAMLRLELRDVQPEVFIVPEGRIITPAAREYLRQRKIGIEMEGKTIRTTKRFSLAEEKVSEPIEDTSVPFKKGGENLSSGKYRDYETGVYYNEKPEHMTHLYGNVLVAKNHPRIRFRGKLDSLQALIVLAQAEIVAAGDKEGVLDDLSNILSVLREMMRCDVLEEPFINESIIGLNHSELRDHSHHPQKYYAIKQMLLPEFPMGVTYAWLNRIRTEVRSCEITALDAYLEQGKLKRPEIVECLNRLSSALHIMMCKYLGKGYE